jgi:hypothetical protein
VSFMYICILLVRDLTLPYCDNLQAKVRHTFLQESHTHLLIIQYAYILLSPHERCYKTRSHPPNTEPRLVYSPLTSSVQPDDGRLKAETCSCFMYLMLLYDLLC